MVNMVINMVNPLVNLFKEQHIPQGFISLTYPDLKTFCVILTSHAGLSRFKPKSQLWMGFSRGEKNHLSAFFWSWTLILRRPVKKRVKTISVWKKLNKRREEQSKGRLLKNQNHSPISISSPYVVAKPHVTWQSRRATLVSPIMLYGKAFLPWSFCKWSLLLLSWPCCFVVGSLTAADVLHCHSW